MNTVPQAITLIGLEAVRSLALSLSVIKTNPNDKGSIHLNQEDFWRHSLTTAILCKKLATIIPNTDPEEAFIAGLMHDMGKLVLLEFTKNSYEIALAQASKAKATLAALEREIFEINHAVLAAELCRHWLIPDVITNAIGKHHEPLIKEESGPDQALAELVSLGNQIAHMMDMGKSGNHLISTEAIRYLNLKKADFDFIQKTIKAVTKGVEDAAKLFGFRETKLIEANPLPVALGLEDPEEKMLVQLIVSSKNHLIIDLSKEPLSEDRLNSKSLKAIIYDKSIPDSEKERLKASQIPALDFDQWKKQYKTDSGMYPVSYLHVWLANP
ncbi:MAG: HDOD domain-containing protein [Deltaproteobacteria bacterium]|nr:MAG: HDOD domain-containing protein [Deltaproteobacteria bacterium]